MNNHDDNDTWQDEKPEVLSDLELRREREIEKGERQQEIENDDKAGNAIVQWTVSDALPLFRLIEPVAVKHGFHAALGGSLCYLGWSNKDMDVIVYPHDFTQAEMQVATEVQKNQSAPDFMGDLEKAVPGLTDLGSASNFTQHESVGPDREVMRASYQGKRIDFLFV